MNVIEVCVRKQDEIDWRKLGKGERRFGQPFRTDGKKWQANSDAGKQNWIAQDGDAEKIDQDGGMTNPCSSEILIPPSIRGWACECSCDWPGTFHDPFPPEMRQPVAALDRAARCLAFRFH